MTESQINIPEELLFPRTINIKILTEYLERPVSYNERCMLEDVKVEKKMNNMLKGLYEQCIKKGNLYVPELTDLDGDCLFASLVYHKIASSVEELRKSLALVMYFYKDYKDFIPGTDLTLHEMFTFMNEIEYVSCKRKINNDYVFVDFYKYTYNVMCQDLTNNHSWTRIPTQLILTVLSYIYKLEIIILSNLNDYENKINAFDNAITKPELKKIYLGHLGESHYVPIAVLSEDEELVPILYEDAKNELLEWAQEMENKKIRKYYYQKQIQQEQQEQQTQQHYYLPMPPMEPIESQSQSMEIKETQPCQQFQEIDLTKIPQDSNYQAYF